MKILFVNNDTGIVREEIVKKNTLAMGFLRERGWNPDAYIVKVNGRYIYGNYRLQKGDRLLISPREVIAIPYVSGKLKEEVIKNNAIQYKK